MSIEHKLLSTLTDPANIAKVWEMGLRPEAFEDPFNAHVFEFITEYWLESEMKTAPTSFAIETARPGFRVQDGIEEQAWWLAEELKTRYTVNQGQQIVIDFANNHRADPVLALKKLTDEAYRASEVISPRHSRSDMSDFEERRRRYRTHEEAQPGIPFGLPEFDEHTGGLLPGELCCVGAYSKVGKTMLLLYIAAMARRAGFVPIVFSLEMSIEEIEDRLDAMLSGVSYSRLSRRKLTIKELEVLHRVQEEIVEMGTGKIRIESPDDGERTVAHLTARARHTGSDLMLIDQLDFMDASRRVNSKKERFEIILKELKNEIRKTSRGRIATVLACQLNRESLDAADGPQLKHFADAAEVERTADLLLGLSRNKQEQANRMMKLAIMAGRRCEPAQYLLHWDLVDRTWIEIEKRIDR